MFNWCSKCKLSCAADLMLFLDPPLPHWGPLVLKYVWLICAFKCTHTSIYCLVIYILHVICCNEDFIFHYLKCLKEIHSEDTNLKTTWHSVSALMNAVVRSGWHIFKNVCLSCLILESIRSHCRMSRDIWILFLLNNKWMMWTLKTFEKEWRSCRKKDKLCVVRFPCRFHVTGGAVFISLILYVQIGRNRHGSWKDDDLIKFDFQSQLL